VGALFFPAGKLNEELEVDDDCLDRSITIEHDQKVLANMFAQLDKLVLVAKGESKSVEGDEMHQ
jgi:hypothetical protein